MATGIKVDISEVVKQSREAQRSLARTGEDMKRVLDKAAREERRTHEYRNRTHRLENSTFALGPFKSGDTVRVEFGARMEYASFVDNRGLTRIRELADRAETEIDFMLDAAAERIGNM